MTASIQYRLIVQPLIPVTDDLFRSAARALSLFPDFRYSPRADSKEGLYEYVISSAGSVSCRIQISNDGLALETSRNGVTIEDWKNWRNNLLKLAQDKLHWLPSDVSVLALVHKHRYPFAGGNPYQLLRERLFSGGIAHDLSRDLTLLDLDFTFKAKLEDGIHLIAKLTSNVAPDDILENAFAQDDTRIIAEFHAVRVSPKPTGSLLELAVAQEADLEKWLQKQSATLAAIVPAE